MKDKKLKEYREALRVVAAVETIAMYCDEQLCRDCVLKKLCKNAGWTLPDEWDLDECEHRLQKILKDD